MIKTKPDLGFWKLWNLSFGFFGVQIAYALQSANVSRIFTTIGADPHDLSYFWILPPLMGLIVQPLVGTLSDRTWTRFGRRLPYLIIGATLAVVVMCLLPNAGSFSFTVSGAILFGLVALMMLDTSINMAMQPFKMLVGDMVNEKQKGLAYSIQSFLCNAGSVMGFIFPICLAWIGMKNTAPNGVVPPTVIWSFYIGAAILMLCVVYSLIKIKEWPPKLYNEYNGIEEKAGEKAESSNLIKLLIKAPKTFWTVSCVQFFCWFAFLFMWTYSPNTVAHNAFHTPTTESVTGLADASQVYEGKYLLINDTVTIVSGGQAHVAGVEIDGHFHPASTVVAAGDTLVADNMVKFDSEARPKVRINEKFDAATGTDVIIDGKHIKAKKDIVVKDYLSRLDGPFDLTTASIVARDKTTGSLTVEDATTHRISEPKLCTYQTKTILNAASPEYNAAGNWVGLLYAVQALGSVCWAMLLPRLGSRKFSYALSLLLGGVGFVLMGIFTDQWLLFIAFLLIGCAWAAMLAWPFTILTNSLKGGNIGAYLGLFNCSICIPQIVAALVGGRILSLMTPPGELAPEYMMIILAGISLGIGAICVAFVKESIDRE